MLTFLSVTSPFPTERDASISATVAMTQKLESYKFQCLVHTAREAQKCEQSIEMYIYKVLNFASICCIARCITFCVKRVLNSFIFHLYRECVKCCACCVVFYGPSTLFRSFRARSVNLATLYLGKPPRQLTST